MKHPFWLLFFLLCAADSAATPPSRAFAEASSPADPYLMLLRLEPDGAWRISHLARHWQSGQVPAPVVPLTDASPDRRQRVGIQRVAWLQGCWETTTGQRTVEEHWMAPRGDSMIGMSRTVRENRLVEFELVILREQGDRLAYEARPSGQAPTVFLSKAVGDSTVVFENPQHDFPQTVGYQRESPDSLLAWIEGVDTGQVRRVDFRYRRTACPESR